MKAWYLYLYDGPIEKPHKQCLAAGPFSTREEADARLEDAREAAGEIDSWTHFYHWATILLPDDSRQGKLNEIMGIENKEGMAV